MPEKKNKLKPRKASPGKALRDLATKAARLDAEHAEQAARDRIESPLRFGVVQNEPEQDLGARLQQARQAAGLTQEQLSKQMRHADKEARGVSAAVISLYERGVNKPGPKELRLLCEALRVTPNFLLYGDEDPFRDRTEVARYGGWGSTDAEFLAYLTYCFLSLHHHHREGMMQIMLGLLRGWNNDFDTHLRASAFDAFISKAKELESLIDERKQKKRP